MVVTTLISVLLYDVPGVFHAVFGWTTPLLGFHDPLHPEFTDALHEWCAVTLTLTLTLTLTPVLTPVLTPPLTLTRRGHPYWRHGFPHTGGLLGAQGAGVGLDAESAALVRVAVVALTSTEVSIAVYV